MGDTLRGIGLIVFIVALAGGIAYIGDRVGHQVGRKRLSLFGIRPRYTSTIVAVGTGMMIALVVVLGALLASNEVKTAFFRLNAVNTRVIQLQSQADELEKHVRNSLVIVNVGDLMNLQGIELNQNEPVDVRYRKLKQFYNQTVNFVNATYTARGLKKFVPPANADKILQDRAQDYQLTAMLSQTPAVVLAQADQNLFANDPIHFGFQFYPDHILFAAGQPIVSVNLPGHAQINLRFVLSQLTERVTQDAIVAGMPAVFAQNVLTALTTAQGEAMQRELNAGTGTYVLTARAAGDIYPHTVAVPLTLSLTKR